MKYYMQILIVFKSILIFGCHGFEVNQTGNNTNFNLAKQLSENDWVFVPAGDHYISETILVGSFKKISGIKGQSRLIATQELKGEIFRLNGVHNVEISDLTFVGNQNGKFSKLSDICNSRDSIKNFEGKTYGIGISILNQSNRCRIDNCEFYYFGDACLKLSNSGGRLFPILLTNILMSKSYCGIDNYGTEYSPATAITVSDCIFGMILNAGNQYFSTCSFVDNKVGLYMMGTNPNNSHGSFSACNFNHSSTYSIYCNGITLGESFVGCQIFEGDIFLDNCNGFNFSSGIIDAKIIVNGGSTNIITNTDFIDSYGGGIITSNFEDSETRLLLKNN